MKKTEQTAEIIKHMLHELESPSKELTQWEETFLESVGAQFEARGSQAYSITERQFEILERIYAEKTS